MQLAQGAEGAIGDSARWFDFCRCNGFPRQGVFFGLLADFVRREESGQKDVGRYAPELGAAAVDAVEHGNGEFHRAEVGGVVDDEVVEVDHGLHGTFAEAVAADDEAASVVLDGGGKDFRGGGRVAVDEDGKRAIVGSAGVVVTFVAHTAFGVGDDDNGAFINEEADGFYRFVE